MTPKYLQLLLLSALIAFGAVEGQNDEELQIPVENDNLFPLDAPSDLDSMPEGSGNGAIEEPITTTLDATETTALPILENMNANTETTEAILEESNNASCPEKCTCHTEGDNEGLIVDCSNAQLAEFPSTVDPRTTVLNLQNNLITEIPKEISNLKNLQELNANENQVMEVQLGSISELPELKVLKLAKNRLIDYPQDLKNSLDLIKLQELDLTDNDMRTSLEPDVFSNFKSLQKLSLPTSTPDLLEGLCSTLMASLEVVCTGSCENEAHECPDAPENLDDDLLAILPGMIAASNVYNENGEPLDTPNNEGAQENTEVPIDTDTKELDDSLIIPKLISESDTSSSDNARSAISKVPAEVAEVNTLVETHKELQKTETDIKVGAATTNTNKGGVDKSVIGLVAAGMIVIVAVILLKKNWGSIRKRFSSSPQANGGTPSTNGTTTLPEEVPLQQKDKSPV